MSFPRYPKYKDSGVEWLGQVPEHWDTTRIKNLFTLMRRAPEPNDEIVTAFRDGEVTLRSNRRVDGFTNALQEHGYQRVLKNDLVIHAMDAFAGAIGVSDSDGKSTPVYSVCTPKRPDVDAHYYGRLMRHMALAGYINSLSKGIRERSTEFRWNEAAEVVVTVPPMSEQAAIVAFLSHETGKIHRLVAEQQRLMGLLKEKRQAVISHAVTKGLNAHSPMKPSGIEWLGDVPEHWRILRLKDVSPRISGRLVYQPAQYFSEDGVPFLMGNNVSERGIQWEDVKFIPDDVNNSFSQHALREGDVVTVRVGAPGVTCVVPKDADGLNCGSLMIIRQSPRFSSHWLASVMNSPVVRRQIDQVQYGAAQEQINITDAVTFRIPTPPLIEQGAIASFLREETERFDTLTTEAQKAINLLQERRTALISAAVTGQIDVRELAAS